MKYKCCECGRVKDILVNHDQLPELFDRCTDECMWGPKGTKGPMLVAKDGTVTGFNKVRFVRTEETPPRGFLAQLMALARRTLGERQRAVVLKPIFWETADGRVLEITKMDTAHLKSAVAWMELQAGDQRALGLATLPKYQAMRAELRKRARPPG